jgi:hypothetical protein
MEKEFEILINTLKKFEGLEIIDFNLSPKVYVHFKLDSETTLIKITKVVSEIKEYHPCVLLVLSSKNIKFSYQLVIEAKDELAAVKALNKHFYMIQNDTKIDLGIPDLSLVTMRQIANELKQRSNLVFAIVWIEDSERDNIAVEGSGNPTQLVGLLTRGTHMAIDWADKNIKFFKPKDDEDV